MRVRPRPVVQAHAQDLPIRLRLGRAASRYCGRWRLQSARVTRELAPFAGEDGSEPFLAEGIVVVVVEAGFSPPPPETGEEADEEEASD